MAGPSLTLRPPRHDDVVPYTEFLADPEVSVWLDDGAQVPLSAARVDAILFRDAWCLWAVECDGTFAGVTSLYQPDLVRGIARYSIVIGDRRRWGQGLGTAVTRQVTEYAFATLGLRKIEAALRHALAGLDRVRYDADLFLLLEAILEKLNAPGMPRLCPSAPGTELKK